MAEVFYGEESTAASFKELLNFLKWCEKNLSVNPFIVGGWAVFAFAGKQKSLDVDVVFKSRKEMDNAMNRYFKENGFQIEEFHDQQTHFVKIVKTPVGLAEIRFDYYCFEDENRLVESNQVSVPWSLLEKNSVEKQINGLKMRLPSPELLLLFKAKALRDRQAFLDARGIRIDATIRARTKSKILKDKADIKDLLESVKMNQAKIKGLLKQTNFSKYFEQTMKEKNE
ncbi:MAG: hypothetical protein V1494_05260 [Candidatus Diapherotrites archaeon]